MSSTTRILSGVTAVALLITAACGSPAASTRHSPTPSSTAVPHLSTPLIAVTYDDNERTSEGPYRAHAELVAAGPKHVRYEVRASGFAPMSFIYDGHRLLVHDQNESPTWSLFEAPEEHPDEFEFVSQVFSAPGSREFAKGCRSATVVGHKLILGRTAVGYHCAAHFLADGSGMSAHVIWLDRKTDVLLQLGRFHATSFDEHPHITSATFSTEPPAGVKVDVYAAQARPHGSLAKAPDFELTRVAGRGSNSVVSLSDYASWPLVLAFFSSDLAFDSTGETCPGCVRSLLELQRLTAGGTRPAVLAVQEGDVGKPGYPLIPEGLHVDVVNDPDAKVQHAFGLSGQVGFAFVDPDGKVHQVFDKAPTDAQLEDALAALRIAAGDN